MSEQVGDLIVVTSAILTDPRFRCCVDCGAGAIDLRILLGQMEKRLILPDGLVLALVPFGVLALVLFGAKHFTFDTSSLNVSKP